MSNKSTILIGKTINQVALASITGVVFWVIFSIYDAVVKVPNVAVEPKLLEPISEELDGKILEEIAKRKQLAPYLDTVLVETQVVEEASASGEVLEE